MSINCARLSDRSVFAVDAKVRSKFTLTSDMMKSAIEDPEALLAARLPSPCMTALADGAGIVSVYPGVLRGVNESTVRPGAAAAIGIQLWLMMEEIVADTRPPTGNVNPNPSGVPVERS